MLLFTVLERKQKVQQQRFAEMANILEDLRYASFLPSEFYCSRYSASAKSSISDVSQHPTAVSCSLHSAKIPRAQHTVDTLCVSSWHFLYLLFAAHLDVGYTGTQCPTIAVEYRVESQWLVFQCEGSGTAPDGECLHFNEAAFKRCKSEFSPVSQVSYAVIRGF